MKELHHELAQTGELFRAGSEDDIAGQSVGTLWQIARLMGKVELL